MRRAFTRAVRRTGRSECRFSLAPSLSTTSYVRRTCDGVWSRRFSGAVIVSTVTLAGALDSPAVPSCLLLSLAVAHSCCCSLLPAALSCCCSLLPAALSCSLSHARLLTLAVGCGRAALAVRPPSVSMPCTPMMVIVCLIWLFFNCTLFTTTVRPRVFMPRHT